MVPLEGSSIPLRIFISVVFPDPLAPRMPIRLPSSIEKLILSMAVILSTNLYVRFSTLKESLWIIISDRKLELMSL